MSDKKIREAVYRFKPLNHRLEYAGSYRGRIFINDSKATNVSSVCFALKNIKRPLVLILGGRYKGTSYKCLGRYMQNVKTLIAYGESGNKIRQDLVGKIKVLPITDFKEACKTALKKSDKGDTILLAPGGSSFDQFKNFEERGNIFKKWIKNLT